MFFVRNELRTRRRFRFCTPCGYYCFNFHFFSFFPSLEKPSSVSHRAQLVTELDKSLSSITVFTLSPRKSERPRARYQQIEDGWHIELDKLVSSSVAQKTKLIPIFKYFHSVQRIWIEPVVLRRKILPVDNSVHLITHYCSNIFAVKHVGKHSPYLFFPDKWFRASIQQVNLSGAINNPLI